MRISDWSSDVCPSDLPHHEGVVLVAVGVAEIAGVEAFAARARRALVAAAMGERDGVEPLHLGLIPGRKRDHRAVAHARRLTVERAGQADAGAARPAPGDEAVEFHRPLRPHRSEEHTSELQSPMRTSYAVFCLKKKTHNH